jgi:opacity protein-like surface antigen
MKKAILFVAVSVFVGLSSIASADDMVPGAYYKGQSDSSVMSVGQTMMQMGASDRSLTNAVNLGSGAGSSRNDAVGINRSFQFGSSQTEQSWKAAKTIEEAQVFGLVPGDCQGDNSDDNYRKAMNQNRNGYMTERLVSNADCEKDHATLK